MQKYFYLDVKLKLRDDSNAVLTRAYFQGSIESSLQSLFGEIGGLTHLEVVKFDEQAKRALLKVPQPSNARVRAALPLIGHFQNIPCYFVVSAESSEPIDF